MIEFTGQNINNIPIGSYVGISTREERNKIYKGRVSKYLTKNDYHPYGIMVELDNGLKGRVKEIYNSDSEIKNKSENVNENPNDIIEPIQKSISINEDEIGYSYKNLFFPYIKNAKEIFIEDAYIRLDYQIKNLVFFCSIIDINNSTVHVNLTTSYNNEYTREEQEKKLNELIAILKEMNIEFSYKFDETLHDRSIKTDTGWRIILGRGLDIFKDTGSLYSPANFDQTKRKCKKTEIIYIRNK